MAGQRQEVDDLRFERDNSSRKRASAVRSRRGSPAQNQAGWGSRRAPGPRACWTSSTSREPSISSIG